MAGRLEIFSIHSLNMPDVSPDIIQEQPEQCAVLRLLTVSLPTVGLTVEA
jgi:hypothetical protein